MNCEAGHCQFVSDFLDTQPVGTAPRIQHQVRAPNSIPVLPQAIPRRMALHEIVDEVKKAF
jgi:hypothetical protein